MSNKNINCLLFYLTYYLSNPAEFIMLKILLALLMLFLISCEMTSQIQEIKNIPEPKKEIIYSPKEDLISDENEDKLENIEITSKDFSGIENFLYKNLSSLTDRYGLFNFSKIETKYEIHRYNAVKCRIFVQNHTQDKKIIQITILHLENNNIYEIYDQNNCQ